MNKTGETLVSGFLPDKNADGSSPIDGISSPNTQIRNIQKSEVTHGGMSPKARAVLRKLVMQVGDVCDQAAANDQREEGSDVMFDGEVDGVRCLLMRVHDHKTDNRPLSPREREIGRLIARGYPNKQVAAILDISIWTVSAHLRRMFAKLNVSSRAALVARMNEHGLMAGMPCAAKETPAESPSARPRPGCITECPLRKAVELSAS